jgi:hypothetical protein
LLKIPASLQRLSPFKGTSQLQFLFYPKSPENDI